MYFKFPIFAIAITGLALLASSGIGGEARSAEWDRWKAHDDAGGTIDFGTWNALLGRYVIVAPGRLNRVRYGDFTAADKTLLAGFIAQMGDLAVSRYPRREQLAYWINLYNALTVKVVLDHYPVASIRDIDISPGLFADGPWGAKLVTVEGVGLSLDDIEHRILRPLWRDNRIHYAVNCASIGCPDLQRRAFTGAKIDAQLDRAARGYINSPRGVSVRSGTVIVSKIFDWYAGDFGGSREGVIEHLLRYAKPELARRIKAIGRIDGSAYDWRLNGA